MIDRDRALTGGGGEDSIKDLGYDNVRRLTGTTGPVVLARRRR